nr:acyltransferase [Paenibacillus brevis]
MNNKNLTINGLRGLLASLVVLYHGYTGMTTSNYLEESYIRQINHFGPFAVNIFFIISGYLILQSLIRSGSIDYFIKNRILRIYPVFFVIHIFIFIAGPVINYEWMGSLSTAEYLLHFVSNLLMLPGVFNLPIAQIVAWSLSYEFAFYIVITVFYFGHKSQSILLKYFSIGAALITSLILLYKHPTMLFFLVGILLCLYSEKITALLKYRYHSWFFFNGILFMLIAIFVYDPENLSLSLIFSFLFFFTVINEEGAFAKIMRSRVFQYLGELSYSLYLWHTFIMFPIKRIIPIVGLEQLNQYVLLVLFTGSSLIISLLASHFSYRLLEVKVVKFLKKSRVFRSNRTPISQRNAGAL